MSCLRAKIESVLLMVIFSLSRIGASADQTIIPNTPEPASVMKTASAGMTVTGEEGIRLSAPLQALEVYVSPSGTIFRSVSALEGHGDFSITPITLGRSVSCEVIPATGAVASQGDEILLLDRTAIIEHFSAGSGGIRQDFVISRKPAGKGALTLTLRVRGAKAATGAVGIMLAIPSGREFVYGDLRVIDANGRTFPATMEAECGSTLKITFRDSGARYPVLIDPTISDKDWVVLNSGGIAGTNGEITSIAYGNGCIYIGGWFTAAGTCSTKNIAKWNGSVWSPIGSGLNGRVTVLSCDKNGVLYAGGGFDSAGSVAVSRIAQWDGTSWSQLGTGSTDTVRFIAQGTGNTLYAKGYFRTATGAQIYGPAKWNGSVWDSLKPRQSSGILSMTCDDSGNLYVGDYYDIQRWDGNSWSTMGRKNVTAIIFDDSGNLYCSEYWDEYSSVTGTYLKYFSVMKCNNNTWSTIIGKQLGSLYTLAADRKGMLYIGGAFGSGNIIKWNGANLESMASGTNKLVCGLACDTTGDLFAIGEFSAAGGTVVKGIAQWNGISWSSPGGGMDGNVRALAVDRARCLYIGGNFTTINGVSARYVARWDGSTWSPLGSGMCSLMPTVNALAVDNSGNLYAGGLFDTAGGVAARHIAKWNGATWDSLGRGLDGEVFALACDNKGSVYAGGGFDSAGGVSAKGVAKWNGVTWDSLGKGITGGQGDLSVRDIIFDKEGNLYAGGCFSSMGGVNSCSVAKWNGVTWDSLGSGLSGSIFALAYDVKGSVYAGGSFLTAGVIRVQNIARWNGVAWDAVAKGIYEYGRVDALVCDTKGNIYAGGRFISASGVTVNNIAQFDGTKWNSLGYGTDGAVNAFSLYDSTLYVGGDFSTAGKKYTPYFASVNTHGTTIGIVAGSGYLNVKGLIRYHLANRALFVSNVTPRDRISIYSLAGRRLMETAGVSSMNLAEISPQTLIIRVDRAGKIVSTGMVLLH